MTADAGPYRLLGQIALGDAVTRLEEAVRPVRTLVGVATVELDRAAAELGAVASEPLPDDELLGARTRLLRLGTDRQVVLLEPSTEGLLAASLARFGEGPVALYLQADAAIARARGAGFTLSAEAGGPIGRQRRAVVGRRWGPHLLIVEPAYRPEPVPSGP